jgi:hypothetical protein
MWDIEIDFAQEYTIRYRGELTGPIGNPHVVYESVQTVPLKRKGEKPYILMEIKDGKGFIRFIFRTSPKGFVVSTDTTQ